jgi:small subunit ribosomal protein S18
VVEQKGFKGRSRYTPRKKVCSFCVEKINDIDYKDVDKLIRFVSDRGKIEPRRKTGNCAKHQRVLAEAVKRARHIAILPFVAEHLRITGVPTQLKTTHMRPRRPRMVDRQTIPQTVTIDAPPPVVEVGDDADTSKNPEEKTVEAT